jgi:large-conductance mechanosensitive channel
MNAATCPTDPIDFISKEKWITVTAIGSIFTFAMVNKFRETIFDPLIVYIIPPESFDFMKIELPDILPSPNVNMANTGSENENSYTINFGAFFRETIIWIFMILLLYILSVYLQFPSIKGGSTGAAII